MTPLHSLRGLLGVRSSSIVLSLALALPSVACGEYQEDPAPNNGTGAAPSGAGAAGGTDASAGGTGNTTAGTGGTDGTSTGGTDSSGGTGGAGPIQQPVPEPSCENVTACAGDPSGLWFAQKSCLVVSGIANIGDLGIGCAEAPISGKIEVTGNFSVGADGSISDNTATTGELQLELEPACLDVSGTVTTCDRIGIPLASGGFTTVDCVDSTTTAGGCTCTAKFDQMGGMGYFLGYDAATSGTYTAANNTLTVTGTSQASDLTALDYAHCVDGNFMHVTPTSTPRFGEVKGTIVLQKQP